MIGVERGVDHPHHPPPLPFMRPPSNTAINRTTTASTALSLAPDSPAAPSARPILTFIPSFLPSLGVPSVEPHALGGTECFEDVWDGFCGSNSPKAAATLPIVLAGR